MHLKPEDTIIVTRHPGIVEWLEKHYSITGIVKQSVTIEDIKGKHIIGEIPAYGAQYAFCVSAIIWPHPWKECDTGTLTYEDVVAMEPELFTYVVVPVVDTDPTDYY